MSFAVTPAHSAIFRWVLLALYATAIGVQLLDHAMWADEAQAWLIARDSDNLVQLWENLRFEGHPPGWYLVIWPVARLSSNFSLLQGLTFVISVTFGSIVLFGRAVPLYLRPVLLAGFLPIFGYGVVSRPYMLGVVLLFIYLNLLAPKKVPAHLAGYLRSIVALLLGSFHLMFAVIAGALLAGEVVTTLRSGKADARRHLSSALGALSLLSLIIILSLPDASSAFVPSSSEFEDLSALSLLAAVGEAAGAAADRKLALRDLMALAAVVMMALATALSTIRSGLLVAGIGVLVMNRVVGYGGQWWHVGVTTFALMTVGLIALSSGAIRSEDEHWSQRAAAGIRLLLGLLLVAQVAVAVEWYGHEERLPYSQGREAAAFVREWCPEDCPIVIDSRATGPSVLAYLGGASAFRLDDRREGTFSVFDSVSDAGEVSWSALEGALRERGPNAIGVLSILRSPPDAFFVIGRTERAYWSREEFLVVALRPAER